MKFLNKFLVLAGVATALLSGSLSGANADLRVKGSDTMLEVGQELAQAYMKSHAGKSVSVLGALACDGDGVRNGSCSLFSGCPACSLSIPACLAPCFNEPHYLLAQIGVGQRATVNIGQRMLFFRCFSAQVQHPHRRPIYWP